MRMAKSSPSRFAAAANAGVRLLVEERGARYPLTIDPIAQQAYLKPAAVGTTQAEDQFGYSVAVSGDTVVVGAPGEDSSTTGVNSTPNESAADCRRGLRLRAQRDDVDAAGLSEARRRRHHAGG